MKYFIQYVKKEVINIALKWHWIYEYIVSEIKQLEINFNTTSTATSVYLNWNENELINN